MNLNSLKKTLISKLLFTRSSNRQTRRINFKLITPAPRTPSIPTSTTSHPRPASLTSQLTLYAIFILILIFTVYQAIHQIPTPSISCQSQYGPCPEYIQNALSQSQSQSLISSLRYLPNNLEHQFPHIQFQGWQYTFPDQFQIHIQLPKATFALKAVLETDQPDPNFSQLVLVDPQGQIITLTSTSSLPQILVTRLTWDHQLTLPPYLQTGIHIIQALLTQGYHYQQARMDNQQLFVTLAQSSDANLTIIFPLHGYSADQLVTALHLILTRSTINLNEISQIDLRYTKPVIR